MSKKKNAESAAVLEEAKAMVAIAKALDGLPRERACAIMSAASAMVGQYEYAAAFARAAKESQ